jgi:hypothetical protein
MIKRKLLLFFVLMVAIVSLFTVSEVMAADCYGDFNVTFDSVRLDTYTGYYVYKYLFESGSLSISKLSFVEFAIPPQFEVDDSDSKVAYSDPLDGGLNGWGEFIPVGIVTITPQVNQGVAPVEFAVKNSDGQRGDVGMSTKAGRSLDGCAITGPGSGELAPQTECLEFSQTFATDTGEKTCKGTVCLEPTFSIEIDEANSDPGCSDVSSGTTYYLKDLKLQGGPFATAGVEALSIEQGWIVAAGQSPGETCYYRKKCKCYKCYTYPD